MGPLRSQDVVRRVPSFSRDFLIHQTRPSARSSDLLLERAIELTVVIGRSPMLDLSGAQLAAGLRDRLLAVGPFGFDGVEPGALARQVAGQDAHPALRLGRAVVLLDPP